MSDSFIFNLQQFAEGGDAGGTGDVGGTGNAGDTGGEPDAAEVAAKHAEEWNKIIKGDFREDYQRAISDQVDRRFKRQDELEKEVAGYGKLKAFLGERYGVESPDEILNAIMDDDALFQEAAAERGLSTDQYKEMKKLQFEKEQSDRELEEIERQRATDEIYAGWIRESEGVKAVYPNFDLQSEMENERFLSLLTKDVDMLTAYQVVHMNDAITGAMQTTAQTVAEKITNNVIARGMRPLENGIASPTQPTVDKVDFSKLSIEDMKNYARRAENGEKITFK
ncbi:MAG: hypothetical protein J6P16_01730 [Eubacterium sp.]|nr:hypothetical protein [Eubacterium sp.]